MVINAGNMDKNDKDDCENDQFLIVEYIRLLLLEGPYYHFPWQVHNVRENVVKRLYSIVCPINGRSLQADNG